MAHPLVLVFPHALGTEEVRRRLDRHTDWAMGKMREAKIQVTAEDWHEDERRFSASALGQVAAGSLRVTQDAVRLEVGLPLALRPFSPVIEAVAKRYAADLFGPKA